MIDELLHLLFTNPKKLKPQEWRALIKMFCTNTGDFGAELDRNSYGFEISKEFYRRAKNEMLNIQFLPTVLNF